MKKILLILLLNPLTSFAQYDSIQAGADRINQIGRSNPYQALDNNVGNQAQQARELRQSQPYSGPETTQNRAVNIHRNDWNN